MKPKTLHEMSAKATDSHPGVFVLFPGKGAEARPRLVSEKGGHWVLLYRLGVKAGTKKAVLPIGLTLVGTSTAA